MILSDEVDVQFVKSGKIKQKAKYFNFIADAFSKGELLL